MRNRRFSRCRATLPHPPDSDNPISFERKNEGRTCDPSQDPSTEGDSYNA